MNIGASRISINWPVGLPLAGYSQRALPSNGYHRDLYVRALVISSDDDEARLCILSGEILCVDRALTERLRAQIHRETGILPHAILVTATHTHASAGGLFHFPVPGSTDAVLGAYSPSLVDHFVEAALRAVRTAARSQTKITLWSGRARTEGIAANRRDPNGVHDPYLPFLVARDGSGVVHSAIFNYACHPTILSAENRLYSGDLIGTTCAILEERWPTALGLTGAAGNISTRFTRRASSVAEVERMAQRLVEAIVTTTVHPVEAGAIASARQAVVLPVRPAPAKADSLRALARAQSRLSEMEDRGERRVVEAEIEGLQLQLNIGERPAQIASEVQVFRLGAAYIIALPGEFFVEYGIDLIDKLRPVPVLIAGYANDYVGYVTTPDASSGYEADTAILAPQAGQIVVQAALYLIDRCR